MKKLLFSTMAVGLLLCYNAGAQQKPADPNAPVITFEKDTIDYGTIEQNAAPFRVFKFTNTGKEPLIISDAVRSCGCTTPSIPKEPVQPGQSSEIKVRYATDRIGRFDKTITVVSNAVNSRQQIVIMGNVLPPEKFGTKSVLQGVSQK